MDKNKIFVKSFRIIGVLLFVLSLSVKELSAHAVPSAYASDTLQIYRNTGVGEGNNVLKTKMLHSAFPVQIKVRGKSMQVISKFNQVLPVYNAGGAFYGVFKLNKGTNWINGLPRGTYYINNTKITIS